MLWFSSCQTSQMSNSLPFFNANFLHRGFPTCIHCAAVSHVFMCGNAWQCVLTPVSSRRYECYSLHSFIAFSVPLFFVIPPLVGVRQTSPACWHRRQIGSWRLENGRTAGRKTELASISPMYTSKDPQLLSTFSVEWGKTKFHLCACVI